MHIGRFVFARIIDFIPERDFRRIVAQYGGDDEGAAFIALADDLEEEVGAGLVERQIADLVQNQNRRRQIAVEFRLEAVGGLRGDQPVDRIDGGGEDDTDAWKLVSKSPFCGTRTTTSYHTLKD